jgi:hypothetical protein
MITKSLVWLQKCRKINYWCSLGTGVLLVGNSIVYKISIFLLLGTRHNYAFQFFSNLSSAVWLNMNSDESILLLSGKIRASIWLSTFSCSCLGNHGSTEMETLLPCVSEREGGHLTCITNMSHDLEIYPWWFKHLSLPWWVQRASMKSTQKKGILELDLKR